MGLLNSINSINTKIDSGINKVGSTINGTSNKVSNSILQGINVFRKIDVTTQNAKNVVDGTIKNVLGITKNIEEQFKNTAAGRFILKGLDKLTSNINDGSLNKKNVGLLDPLAQAGQREALNGSVGAYVDVFSGLTESKDNPLSDIVRNIKTSTVARRKGKGLDVPSAAAEYVASGSLLPKYKYKFVVDLKMNPLYTGNQTNSFLRTFTFLTTEIERPKISFETDTVNSYNFRFAVRKTMKFDPLDLSLHDDDDNNAMHMVMTLLRSLSPMMNSNTQSSNIYEPTNGMDFYKKSVSYDGKQNNSYLASVGPIHGPDLWNGGKEDDKAKYVDPIISITIYHLYNNGKNVNTYTYINPKITQVDMDKLSMTDTTVFNTIKLKFIYDNVIIEDTQQASKHSNKIEQKLGVAGLKTNAGKDKNTKETDTSRSLSKTYSQADVRRIVNAIDATNKPTYSQADVRRIDNAIDAMKDDVRPQVSGLDPNEVIISPDTSSVLKNSTTSVVEEYPLI